MYNYTPPFGTKKSANEGLSTREGCNNLAMPWLQQRPIVVSETSTVSGTHIEYNAVIEIDTSGITLTLKPGAYKGCKLTVIASFGSGTATVAGVSQSITVESGKIYELIYDGTDWAVHSNGSEGGGGGGEFPTPTYIINSNDSLAYFLTKGARGVSSGGNDFSVVYVEDGNYSFTYTAEDDTNQNYKQTRCIFNDHYLNSSGFVSRKATLNITIASDATNYRGVFWNDCQITYNEYCDIIGLNIYIDYQKSTYPPIHIQGQINLKYCCGKTNIGTLFRVHSASDCEAQKLTTASNFSDTIFFAGYHVYNNYGRSVFRRCKILSSDYTGLGTRIEIDGFSHALLEDCESYNMSGEGHIWDANYCGDTETVTGIDGGIFKRVRGCSINRATITHYLYECKRVENSVLITTADSSGIGISYCEDIKNCYIDYCYELGGIAGDIYISNCNNIQNIVISNYELDRKVVFDTCLNIRDVRVDEGTYGVRNVVLQNCKKVQNVHPFSSATMDISDIDKLNLTYTACEDVEGCVGVGEELVSGVLKVFDNCLVLHNCKAYYKSGMTPYSDSYASHTANASYVPADTPNGGWNYSEVIS